MDRMERQEGERKGKKRRKDEQRHFGAVRNKQSLVAFSNSWV